MPFKSRTGMLGSTEPQTVTEKNVAELPPGSVVRLHDGGRLIHLHNAVWLYCTDDAHCYDRIENLAWRCGKKSQLCHIP